MTRIAIPPSVDLSTVEARNSLDILERLAIRLDVTTSIHRKGENTTVNVYGPGHRTTQLKAICTTGAILSMISGAIEDYRQTFGPFDLTQPWTEAEVMQIAAQSGLEVQRA